MAATDPRRTAVIVATARTPIGRAGKGSLVEFRPDDLAALAIRSALAKVPQLDPTTLDDVYLGCGLPGGESGFNMARVVNVLNGMDGIPGATVNRYCSSSIQTTRMAFHAIASGEGDAFVSAGVETVSRFAKGTSDHLPDTQNPLFAEAGERTSAYAEGGRDWHDPRLDGDLPDVLHLHGTDRGERCPPDRRSPVGDGSLRRTIAEPCRSGSAQRFLEREITPVTRSMAAWSVRTTARVPV